MKLIHVGKLLKEGYLEPSGMTLKQLSDLTGVSVPALSRLMSGKSSMTPSMAVKLEKVWKRKASTWLYHQVNYELQQESSIEVLR